MAGTTQGDQGWGYGQTTLGQIPSAVWDQQLRGGPPYLTPVMTGSQAGVPGINHVAGESDTSGGSAVDYGQRSVGQPVSKQPVFWLMVLCVMGIWLIGYAAHVSSRD